MTLLCARTRSDGHVLVGGHVLWVEVFVICQEVFSSGVELDWEKGTVPKIGLSWGMDIMIIVSLLG